MRLFAGPRNLSLPASVFHRRLRQDESGATAIEFAMVIGPFLGLLFAVMEVALVYFAQFSLENANETASRLIRTGKVQTLHMTAGQFRQKVCNSLPAFMTCDKSLIVDVRSHPTFAEAAADLPSPLAADGSFNAGFQAAFTPGGPSQVVVVTLFYDWRLFIGLPGLGDFTGKLGLGVGNMPDGSRLITAGFASKTEPY